MNEAEKNLTMDNIVAEKPDYVQEITVIIGGNDSPKKMLGKLEDYHENDIAQVIPLLNVSERRKFYRICHVEMLAEIFEYFDEDDASIYLDEMDIRKAADVVSRLETDTAAKVLHELPRDKRELIVDAINPEIRERIRLIASFDEDEIGSRMTTNYIVIRENLTVKQAMSELVRQAEENDNLTTIFVVDENGEFYGALDLKELIIARSTTDLESLITTSFPYVYANELIDDCIEKLKDYSESIIPVLDNSNRILGVITSQSIIEVVDDEMGEDYARLAGLTAEEDLNESLIESMKNVCHGCLYYYVLACLFQQWLEYLRRLYHSLLLLWHFSH